MTRFSSGPRLRQARIDAGLSVEAVALSVGRTAYSINAYELGQVEPPIHVLQKLAELCGTTVGALLDDARRPIATAGGGANV